MHQNGETQAVMTGKIIIIKDNNIDWKAQSLDGDIEFLKTYEKEGDKKRIWLSKLEALCWQGNDQGYRSNKITTSWYRFIYIINEDAFCKCLEKQKLENCCFPQGLCLSVTRVEDLVNVISFLLSRQASL